MTGFSAILQFRTHFILNTWMPRCCSFLRYLIVSSTKKKIYSVRGNQCILLKIIIQNNFIFKNMIHKSIISECHPTLELSASVYRQFTWKDIVLDMIIIQRFNFALKMRKPITHFFDSWLLFILVSCYIFYLTLQMWMSVFWEEAGGKVVRLLDGFNVSL